MVQAPSGSGLPAAVPADPVSDRMPTEQAGLTQAATATATTTTTTTATATATANQAATPPARQPAGVSATGAIQTLDGEQYIDSTYLEQQEFNPEGRKRFYAIPEAGGPVNVVERRSGVRLDRLVKPPEALPPAFSLSERYQLVPAASIRQLLSLQCLAARPLKRAKRFRSASADLGVWPSSPLSADEFAFELIDLPDRTSGISLISYADREQQPGFYWPLAVFLDAQGCIMEGASGFYLRTLPATPLQRAALEGNLRIPAGARYLLLTPIAEAPDLGQIRLASRGALRLTRR